MYLSMLARFSWSLIRLVLGIPSTAFSLVGSLVNPFGSTFASALALLFGVWVLIKAFRPISNSFGMSRCVSEVMQTSQTLVDSCLAPACQIVHSAQRTDAVLYLHV